MSGHYTHDRCAVPDPIESFWQFLRFSHHDLADLPSAELRRERFLMHMRVARDAKPHPWFAQRLEAVQAELRLRRPQVGASGAGDDAPVALPGEAGGR